MPFSKQYEEIMKHFAIGAMLATLWITPVFAAEAPLSVKVEGGRGE